MLLFRPYICIAYKCNKTKL